LADTHTSFLTRSGMYGAGRCQFSKVNQKSVIHINGATREKMSLLQPRAPGGLAFWSDFKRSSKPPRGCSARGSSVFYYQLSLSSEGLSQALFAHFGSRQRAHFLASGL
jgi:hypothetical protein